MAEIESGIETVDQGAMPDETMTDHPGETETYSMTEEAVVEDDEVAEVVVTETEAGAKIATNLQHNARRAQHLHPRRRNLHRI